MSGYMDHPECCFPINMSFSVQIKLNEAIFEEIIRNAEKMEQKKKWRKFVESKCK